MSHKIPRSRDSRADVTKGTIRNCFRRLFARAGDDKILSATKPSLVLPKCGATATAGSMVGEFVSVDDGFVTPEEFERPQHRTEHK